MPFWKVLLRKLLSPGGYDTNGLRLFPQNVKPEFYCPTLSGLTIRFPGPAFFRSLLVEGTNSLVRSEIASNLHRILGPTLLSGITFNSVDLFTEATIPRSSNCKVKAQHSPRSPLIA